MILAQKEVLLKLIELIERAYKACPQLRLLLAGRFGASDLPSEFLSGYGAVTETTTLTPFTLEEAVGYFIDKRRLNPSHPLNEMWLASGGNPFMLSLFAEMAASRRSLTADEVKKIKNPQLAYVLRRVIRRIEERDLRWVVRYGVVPRNLTREFLRDVMDRPLRLRLPANRLRTGSMKTTCRTSPTTRRGPRTFCHPRTQS